jgi:amylosucrase
MAAEPGWLRREAGRSLARLRPRLEALFADAPADAWPPFERRLEARFPALFEALHALYGQHYDFFWQLERILATAARAWIGRPADLKELDASREADPVWFLSHRQVGAVCYVDRFAGDLAGLRAGLPHLGTLGVTYLHLMPLFRCPPGENDGGYAVSSYREVRPDLGTMAELAALARELRARGISLVLDFVLNHTADDHAWAQRAKAGDPEHQAYYLMFDDRRLPEAYLRHLREIFPDRGGDSFTWRPDVAGPAGGKWVWTTFYTFQWDLNYANPALFDAMLGEMLFLANQGVEILRLDAVPFLWKRLGTNCENLPEAHTVVQALNALTDVACPAVVFKSEAIVHPDEVARYIDPAKCHLSYNPLFMVLVWEALATRDTRLMRLCLDTRFRTAEGTSWVNYLRGHDDIGWGFADEDARELGIDGHGHRRFLNDFYTGRFPGSFARGLPFQENPRTGDCRISGTLASLAGLEKAQDEGDAREAELSVRRILMMHGLIATLGGIPLIYLGDEIAQPNDYAYRLDAATARDNRWVHRPRFDRTRLARAEADPTSPEGRVLHGLRRLLSLRASEPALSGSDMQVVRLDDRHLIAFLRRDRADRLLVVANLSEHSVVVPGPTVRRQAGTARFASLVEGGELDAAGGMAVEPYGFMVLRPLTATAPAAGPEE